MLQEALLAAVAAGRDVDDAANHRWLTGVIRNQAALTARTAARRRRREARWVHEREDAAPSEPMPVADVLSGLPPSLKSVAALALTGHSKREIAYLLDLPETALRQRFTALRRTLAARGIPLPATTPGLNLDLQYGRIRDALLPLLLAQGAPLRATIPTGIFLSCGSLTNPRPAATKGR